MNAKTSTPCLLAILFIAFFYLSTSSDLQAQIPFQDVIYLNDGGIVRGTIIKRGPNEQLTIETVGNNVQVIQQVDIKEVKRTAIDENQKKKSKKDNVNHSDHTITNPNSIHTDTNTGNNYSFTNITEFGVLLGKSDFGEEAHLSLQTINAFSFKEYASIGLGIGLDVYSDSKVFPVFVDLRGNLLKGKIVSPFVFANIGYGFTSADNIVEFDDEQRGGMMYNIGGGLKFKVRNNLALNIGIGYKQQRTFAKYSIDSGGTLPPSVYERTIDFQRMSLRMGIQF